jgi:hypothetical protein
MKRLYSIVLVVVLFSLLIASLAFAQASGPPQKDTYVTITSPNNSYGGAALIHATADSDTSRPCEPERRMYMEWDLSSITDPNQLSSATLSLNVLQWLNGDSNDFDVALYESDNAPDLNAITWNSQPTIGSLIETQPAVGTGGTVTFSSAALADYLKTKIGGNATFMIQLAPKSGITTCNNETLTSTSIEAGFGTPADLQVAGPTAVTLSAFSAGNGQASWPLAVGLIALAAVVAGGAFGLRRFNS